MSRRVVVTGMGAITPIGLSVESFWEGVKAGKTGFAPITRFDTTDYKCHLAAEVKDFDGKEYMDFKAAKRMELFCQYAVAATKEAMEDAGLNMEEEHPSESAFPWAQALVPYRQWKENTASFWKKDLPA